MESYALSPVEKVTGTRARHVLSGVLDVICLGRRLLEVGCPLCDEEDESGA